MKKLFAILALTVALFLAPQKAEAAGGCQYYWVPLSMFFQFGGSVYVVPQVGLPYSVNASNVVSGAHYPLGAGDQVIVWPPPAPNPTCATWYWGWTYLCPCNNQGGVTCGAAQPRATSGVQWIHWTVYLRCDCPNGSSDAGFTYVAARFCEAAPPPPQ